MILNESVDWKYKVIDFFVITANKLAIYIKISSK